MSRIRAAKEIRREGAATPVLFGFLALAVTTVAFGKAQGRRPSTKATQHSARQELAAGLYEQLFFMEKDGGVDVSDDLHDHLVPLAARMGISIRCAPIFSTHAAYPSSSSDWRNVSVDVADKPVRPALRCKGNYVVVGPFLSLPDLVKFKSSVDEAGSTNSWMGLLDSNFVIGARARISGYDDPRVVKESDRGCGSRFPTKDDVAAAVVGEGLDDVADSNLPANRRNTPLARAVKIRSVKPYKWPCSFDVDLTLDEVPQSRWIGFYKGTWHVVQGSD